MFNAGNSRGGQPNTLSWLGNRGKNLPKPQMRTIKLNPGIPCTRELPLGAWTEAETQTAAGRHPQQLENSDRRGEEN